MRGAIVLVCLMCAAVCGSAFVGLGTVRSESAPVGVEGPALALPDARAPAAVPASSLAVSLSLYPCGSPIDVTNGFVPAGIEVCVLVHVESDGSNVSGATVSLADTQGDLFEPLSPSQGWLTNATGDDWGIFESPIILSTLDTITASATGDGLSGSGQTTLDIGARVNLLTLNVTGGSNGPEGGSEQILATLSWNPGKGFWVPVQGAIFIAIGSDGRTLYNGPPAVTGNEALIAFSSPVDLSANQTYSVTVFAQMLGFTVGEGFDSFEVFLVGSAPNHNPFPYDPTVVALALLVGVLVYVAANRRLSQPPLSAAERAILSGVIQPRSPTQVRSVPNSDRDSSERR